jgi:hypothetical protein
MKWNLGHKCLITVYLLLWWKNSRIWFKGNTSKCRINVFHKKIQVIDYLMVLSVNAV